MRETVINTRSPARSDGSTSAERALISRAVESPYQPTALDARPLGELSPKAGGRHPYERRSSPTWEGLAYEDDGARTVDPSPLRRWPRYSRYAA